MTNSQREALIRTLLILLAAYEPKVDSEELAKRDTEAYSAGFRAGARSAYADAICRLREIRTQAAA
jgi:hypothetical protein